MEIWALPLLGKMPFRKWWWASLPWKEDAKSRPTWGGQEGGRINDDSDRGIEHFQKSGSSLADDGRLWSAGGSSSRRFSTILTMDRDFWSGSSSWAKSSMRNIPPGLVPEAVGHRPLSGSSSPGPLVTLVHSGRGVVLSILQ
jgi:hypothetical protein